MPNDLLSKSILQDVLDSFARLKIGVIGDVGLDAFYFVDLTLSHISRERPLLVNAVVRETYALGAAGNISQNLVSLGVEEVKLFSILGSDWRGHQIMKMIKEKQKIHTEGLLQSEDVNTLMFGRFIYMSPELSDEMGRFDIVNTKKIRRALSKKLVHAIEDLSVEMDALIVVDQVKGGVITQSLVRYLNQMARRGKFVIVDSRNDISKFSNCAWKINRFEATKLFFPNHKYEEARVEGLVEASLKFHRKGVPLICVTLGKEGCIIATEGRSVFIPAVRVSHPVYPVGAGDAFLAALTASLAVGQPGVVSALIANLAAATTVTQFYAPGTIIPANMVKKVDEYIHLAEQQCTDLLSFS